MCHFLLCKKSPQTYWLKITATHLAQNSVDRQWLGTAGWFFCCLCWAHARGCSQLAWNGFNHMSGKWQSITGAKEITRSWVSSAHALPGACSHDAKCKFPKAARGQVTVHKSANGPLAKARHIANPIFKRWRARLYLWVGEAPTSH